MQKTIDVAELQGRLGGVLDEVARQGVPYVLLRGSRPEAVVIPYEQFLRYRRLEEQDPLARFDELRARQAAHSRDVDEDEIAADVEAAIREVREARREAKR